jgi:hypothetical protein
MILMVETSELSFEPTIEGRSNRSAREIPSGVTKKCVGVDPGANHCDENRRWCSLRKHGRSTTRGRMVHDLAQGLVSLLDEPDGSRLVVERSAHAQGRQSSSAAPESRSREGPHRGGEILGFVLGSAGHLKHL